MRESYSVSVNLPLTSSCLSSYLHDLTSGNTHYLEALSKVQHCFSTNLSYHFLDVQWLADASLVVVTASVHVFAWLV